MDIKITKFCASTLILYSLFMNSSIAASENSIVRNYAFAMCLSEEYSKGKIVDDAILVMEGYRQRSDLPLSTFNEIYKSYKDWQPSKSYLSKSGDIVVLDRCMDFRDSNQLDDL